MATVRDRKRSVRCPCCCRAFETVLDYPRVEVQSVELLPQPEHAYSGHAINGPAEMEIQRAPGLWLCKVASQEGDPEPRSSKYIYLLDRYTGVAGAGDAFREFQASGNASMKFKELLFERKHHELFRREMFTVQEDLMPGIREVFPAEWLRKYCRRLRRLEGKVVATEVLHPACKQKGDVEKGGRKRDFGLVRGGLGVDLCADHPPKVPGSTQVKVAVTYCSGGSISIIEPLFYIAALRLTGLLRGDGSDL